MGRGVGPNGCRKQEGVTRPWLTVTGGGGDGIAAWAPPPDHPPTPPHQKIVHQKKKENLSKGPEIGGGFTYTNFFLASDPPPPPPIVTCELSRVTPPPPTAVEVAVATQPWPGGHLHRTRTAVSPGKQARLPHAGTEARRELLHDPPCMGPGSGAEAVSPGRRAPHHMWNSPGLS